MADSSSYKHLLSVLGVNLHKDDCSLISTGHRHWRWRWSRGAWP